MNIGTEVYPRLFVGDGAAWLELEEFMRHGATDPEGWYVVHAAKLPWHKDFCGYTGRGAPKDSPEYYAARRHNRLALNLIDVESVDYMPPELFQTALDFISEGYEAGKKVLIHCNQGGSRAPSLALLWLRNQPPYQHMGFEEAEDYFRVRYPAYEPAGGPREFVRRRWDADPLVAAA